MSSGDIKVSVIMPIYNAIDYLRPAIDSVIDQTLRELELICVDDGSTDGSLHVLKEYRERDPRVRIMTTQSNAGAAAARNKGLAGARGEYVIFLDADDFVEPTLLEQLYAAACSDRLDITVAKYDLYNDKKACFERTVKCDKGEIFETDRVVSRSTHPSIIFQCTTGYVWNKLFRRSFLVEKGLSFDSELYVFEDTYFVMTALALASAVGKVQQVLVHHRIYSDQAKKRLFKKYYGQVPEIYVRIKRFLMAQGAYVPLTYSFLTLSASRSYKIYNLLSGDSKSEFWDAYHGTYAAELAWDKADAEDFESEEIRDFVANVLLYTHKQYERREREGKTVRIDRVGRRLRRRELNERLKSLFVGEKRG